MKNYLTGCVALLLITVFSSCQKEVSDDGGGTSASNDSTYLSKYVILDTTYAPGLDTSSVFTFSYDNKKRLSGIYRISYLPGSHNIEYQSWEARFYGGDDAVPYKIAHKLEDPGFAEVETDTLFLYYNGTGVVQRDTSVFYANGLLDTRIARVYNSTGAGKGTVETKVYIDLNTIPVSSSIHRIINNTASGNFNSARDSFFVLRPAPEFAQLNQSDFLYDSKTNPFLQFMIPYPVHSSSNSYRHDLYGECFTNPSRNNLLNFSTTISTSIGTTLTVSNTMRYEYTNAGLPAVIRYSGASDRAARKDRLFYTKL